MRRTIRWAALVGAGAATLALCLPAVAGATTSSAASYPGSGGYSGPTVPGGPLFALTNDTTGNQIVSYQQTGRGGLRPVERVDTGGLGVALAGATFDDLASQGGLAYDATDGVLVAVNGGSNTVSEFRTLGAVVGLRRVVPSGGTIPVSVALRGDLLYVLNAGGAGEVQGYYADSLRPIPGSARSLGLTAGATPQFLNTPGQIGFTPAGNQLIVTTKANGSAIDVFSIGPSGALSAPTVNASATPVPFGFTFDRTGHLVVTEAGTSAVTTYTVNPTGTVTERGSVPDGLTALCWVTSAGGRFFYGSNAGSATVTAYVISPSGVPSAIGSTATDPGPIDLAASPDGSALYVETGGSDIIDTFAVTPTGALVRTGSVAPELPGHTGLEGIAVG
jgi:hypothetical protein